MGSLTLSAIEEWDTKHLESAAQSWDATAEHWENTFSAVHQGAINPGGTVWDGAGAEAAQQRTFADLVKVRGLADHLTGAAAVARRGADHLDSLKRAALDAIDEARTAGFDVGEDLSLSDRSLTPIGAAFAARQAQAQRLAAEIHLRAAALSAADHEIAGNITAATAPLSGLAFDEESATSAGEDAPAGSEDPEVRLVGYKTAPATDSEPPAVPDQGITVVPDDQVIRGNLDYPPDPRIGDERYGHWENVPPFMGPRNGPPPPLTTEITKFPTDPASLAARTAPPTNFVTPGKSWIGDTDPPYAQYQEQYRIRISGTEATPYSRMVASGGKMQEQRWVQNTYEVQTNTRTVFGGPVESGPVRDGDLGGLPAVPLYGRWQPASIADIARLSAANPDTKFYLPGDCGFSNMKGGVLTNGYSGKLPAPPVMTVPR